jgi:hypothetical protein
VVQVRTYRGHRVELESEQVRGREWLARATIVIVDGRKEKRIPIYGRRQATFDAKNKADAYALELAKLWIDGRTYGANGHG